MNEFIFRGREEAEWARARGKPPRRTVFKNRAGLLMIAAYRAYRAGDKLEMAERLKLRECHLAECLRRPHLCRRPGPPLLRRGHWPADGWAIYLAGCHRGFHYLLISFSCLLYLHPMVAVYIFCHPSKILFPP